MSYYAPVVVQYSPLSCVLKGAILISKINLNVWKLQYHTLHELQDSLESMHSMVTYGGL